MARKSRIEAWNSTPFTNYVFNSARSDEEYTRLVKEIQEFHHSRYRDAQKTGKLLSCVNFAKKIIGKQDYTWCGEFRNWVWERDDWRLFVNNTQGLCFEVREGLEEEDAFKAWVDIRERFKVA